MNEQAKRPEQYITWKGEPIGLDMDKRDMLDALQWALNDNAALREKASRALDNAASWRHAAHRWVREAEADRRRPGLHLGDSFWIGALCAGIVLVGAWMAFNGF